MERCSAHTRRAAGRAREWAGANVAWGILVEVAVLGAAALAALFGVLKLEDALIGAAIGSAGNASIYAVAFGVAYIQIAVHPERDKHWEARARPAGPQTLHLELQRIDRTSQHTYGDRCTVQHPNGGSFTATDEGEGWATSFWFRFGSGNSDFPPDAPLPVSGSYTITWKLRLKPDGRWQEIVHERDVRMTMPVGES